VRIDRIRVEGFGRLQSFDTGPTGLPGLVVVAGPNEAGKSTLFSFLTTALYGFHPAARERNPHVPWGADEAAGSVRLQLDAGGCAEIERRLRSQPSARLALDGSSSELRNQPLPWVEHVPRTVFRQVFAVTLAELAVLDSETWARIQDKVVGTMGAADLRSARMAAEDLEREAGEIWRPNRRGNQRLRDLTARARALRARRTEAFERDTQARRLAQEIEQLQDRLREAREQRQRDRLTVERTQALAPVQRQRQRIAALRAEAGNPSEIAELPPDPPARLVELEAERSRIERRLTALERELGEREETVAAFDARSQRVLGHRDEVIGLAARVASSSAERPRAAELEAELADIEDQLDRAAQPILLIDWRQAPHEAIEAVPVDALGAQVSGAATAAPVTQERRPAAPVGAILLALVAGLVLLLWGVPRGSLGAATAGAGLAAVALTAAALSLRALRAGARRRAGPGVGSGEVSAETRAALAAVPLRPERLHHPDRDLVGRLGRMQLLLRERSLKTRTLENLRDRLRAVDRDATALDRLVNEDALAGGTERDASTRDARAVARALDLDLREAERLEQAARGARRELVRLSEDRDRLRKEAGPVDDEIAALRAAGERLGGGDALAGLEAARSRLAARRRADAVREELERAHPDLADLERRIDAAGDSVVDAWGLDDEELALTRARLEELEGEIEELVKRSEALSHEVARLRELETVDQVDSETASLSERQAALERERDRKWVLAKLLREADRRFREEHQPDLLRRASSYLRHLTGGRYHRLLVDDRQGADLFQVVGPDLPAPMALAPPVSTGTLEQAYLSLRLAIVDHLDQGGERLPLFVDEVFVNWDRARRSRGLEVLAAVARARQVFVFTCHDGLAAELEARGARVLALAAGRGPEAPGSLHDA
jgi:uncharacterized protein YhaN